MEVPGRAGHIALQDLDRDLVGASGLARSRVRRDVGDHVVEPLGVVDARDPVLEHARPDLGLDRLQDDPAEQVGVLGDRPEGDGLERLGAVHRLGVHRQLDRHRRATVTRRLVDRHRIPDAIAAVVHATDRQRPGWHQDTRPSPPMRTFSMIASPTLRDSRLMNCGSEKSAPWRLMVVLIVTWVPVSRPP